MLGIRWFHGYHALALMIVSILLFGTTFGVFGVGLGIMTLDVTYNIVHKKRED